MRPALVIHPTRNHHAHHTDPGDALCAQHLRHRSETPLAEDADALAAPSIFAPGKHDSRSERYTYIPTIEVLRGLRRKASSPSWSRRARAASKARPSTPST